MDAETALKRITGRDVIVFDGVCVFCSGFMQFIHKRDRQGRFAFVLAQSELGEALYEYTGMKAGDYETNLVFIDGVLYHKLDTFCAVMGAVGWPWRGLAVLRFLPGGVKDWLYDRVARNRYALFGKYPVCMVPDERLKARFID